MKLSKTGSENGNDFRYDRELPDGTYEADVIDAREDVSKKGNDMIVITFGIKGPNGGVRIDNYITTNYAPRIESMIQALASEHLASWNSTGAIDLNPSDLEGRSCRTVIKGEEWEGKMRPKVDVMLPLEL